MKATAFLLGKGKGEHRLAGDVVPGGPGSFKGEYEGEARHKVGDVPGARRRLAHSSVRPSSRGRSPTPGLPPVPFPKRPVVAFSLLFALTTAALAQDRPPTPPWTKDPPERVAPKSGPRPKVAIAWDRYQHLDELQQSMRDLAAAWPDLVELRSIGKSVEGRDLLLAVVTDKATGSDTGKTAFWCDGNIHGNEVQGGEACLYLVWWLCENRDRLPRAKELLQQRAFYVLPCVNPDGRAHWFDAPNTMHSSRGGKRPVDNDRDGLFDEDGPEDLDGDGEICEMRIEDQDGDWKPDPEDPRLMVRCEPGERGKWRRLGDEGVDGDGDGRVNEDGWGGYDPNRDWPSDWRTGSEQHGAGPYPCSLPETRAVVDFLTSHPNVAGFQSFHNNGGMILRGPGSQSFGAYPEKDDRVLRAIAARGEEQLPFYRSMVIWRDLYQVYGGEVNFAYEMLGSMSFTNELWNADQYRGRPPADKQAARERLRFDDDVELGARYVAWHGFDHPQLGRIEIGGWRKETGRVPPPFMIEELLHRNMAFVLYHASQMPLVKAGEVTVRKLPGGLAECEAVFLDDGAIPTRTQRAADRRIGAPDRAVVTVQEGDAQVVSGGIVDPATGRVLAPDVRRPADLRLPEGIGGNGAVRLRWLVRGSGTLLVTYRAEKGGSASLTVDLK